MKKEKEKEKPKNMKYSTTQVFTPTIPAKLTFIERDELNDTLVDAITTPGKQIIVYGHSGSGKTTLLINKLNQLYENLITSRCTLNIDINKLVLDAFDKLNPFYTLEELQKSSNKIGGDIGVSYFDIKTALKVERSDETSSKKSRILPPQLTPQRLAEFLGAAKCCWVLEDFHKVQEKDKKELAQIMKVFMDTAEDYADVKIICIGAVGTAREVVQYDDEMQNRVSELHVPLMSKHQLIQIINKGEKLLNIEFNENVKDIISDISNGLAAVCHQICLNICLMNRIFQTTDEKVKFTEIDLNKAIQKYVNEQSDTFRSSFDKAIKFHHSSNTEDSELILRAISRIEKETVNFNEILKAIQRINPNYPEKKLPTQLEILCSPEKDEMLKYDTNAGTYSFKNPFVKVYAMMMFKETNFSIHNSKNVIVGNSNIVVQGHFGMGDNVGGNKIINYIKKDDNED